MPTIPVAVFAAIRWADGGRYNVSDIVATFATDKAAQCYADRMNEKDPTLALVVRTIRYMHGAPTERHTNS